MVRISRGKVNILSHGIQTNQSFPVIDVSAVGAVFFIKKTENFRRMDDGPGGVGRQAVFRCPAMV